MHLLVFIISAFIALVVIAIKYDKIVPPLSRKVKFIVLRISENTFFIKIRAKFRSKCKEWNLTERVFLYLIGFVYGISSLIILITLFVRINETGFSFSPLKNLYIGVIILTHMSLIIASFGLFLMKKASVYFLSVALVGYIINFIWFIYRKQNWIDVLTFEKFPGGVFSSWIILGIIYEYCRSLTKKGILS